MHNMRIDALPSYTHIDVISYLGEVKLSPMKMTNAGFNRRIEVYIPLLCQWTPIAWQYHAC